MFQQNEIHFSAIQQSLQHTKAMIEQVGATMKPIAVFKDALRLQYKDLELTLNSLQEQVLVNLCKNYKTSLVENLNKHFSEADPVLGAFSIFNPSILPTAKEPEFSEYGIGNVKFIAGHFHLTH